MAQPSGERTNTVHFAFDRASGLCDGAVVEAIVSTSPQFTLTVKI